ncbi:MAG: aldo/keto reductase [Eubacteriaceae bacterium]|nr:aldo/keto reductase [Eubacteriaceae bacterium]
MLKSTFKDKALPLLGFGTMRLPMKEGQIDEFELRQMVRYAMENGVNYFDTAYPYVDSESERAIGRILKEYPRESFYLATKYPGHQVLSDYDPKKIFEEQLEKCGVDYFDFYLLHNVYENSIHRYMDPGLGIIEYLLEQKKAGRIRHLGFSTHGGMENLKVFLGAFKEAMEFCLIQLNYLDWSLQDGKSVSSFLADNGIPVFVMEPLRGGALASLPDEAQSKLKSLRPNESIASWAFRWLHTVDNVKLILSGMSNFDQMVDNIKTFSTHAPLTGQEIQLLYELADKMKDSIPCTDCGYCLDSCPNNINIPLMLDYYSQMRVQLTTNISMRVDAIPTDEQPSACIECGACTEMCPQNIDIPQALGEFREILETLPSWEQISADREVAAEKSREKYRQQE